MQGTSINFQRFLVGAWEFPTYNHKETDQGGPLALWQGPTPLQRSHFRFGAPVTFDYKVSIFGNLCPCNTLVPANMPLYVTGVTGALQGLQGL